MNNNTKDLENQFRLLNAKNEHFQSKELKNEIYDKEVKQSSQNRGVEKIEKVTLSFNVGYTGDPEEEVDVEERTEYKDFSKIFNKNKSNDPEMKSGHQGQSQPIPVQNRGSPFCNIIETAPIEKQEFNIKSEEKQNGYEETKSIPIEKPSSKIVYQRVTPIKQVSETKESNFNKDLDKSKKFKLYQPKN
jgi:hypothetical protein